MSSRWMNFKKKKTYRNKKKRERQRLSNVHQVSMGPTGLSSPCQDLLVVPGAQLSRFGFSEMLDIISMDLREKILRGQNSHHPRCEQAPGKAILQDRDPGVLIFYSGHMGTAPAAGPGSDEHWVVPRACGLEEGFWSLICHVIADR